MAEVSVEHELAVEPDEAWKVVGDFVGFVAAQGLQVEGEGTGIGMLRVITVGDATIAERLEERDEDARRVVYTVTRGSLPLTDYRSTVEVEPAGPGRSTVRWSATFQPVGGDAEGVASFLTGAYQHGLAALGKHLGG